MLLEKEENFINYIRNYKFFIKGIILKILLLKKSKNK